MDGGSSRSADQVSQLVERAESVGSTPGDRSRRFARVMDGKFSLDAPGKNRDALGTKTDERPGESTPPRSKSSSEISQGWELRRSLSACRRRDAEDLAHRRARNARVANGRLGLEVESLRRTRP